MNIILCKNKHEDVDKCIEKLTDFEDKVSDMVYSAYSNTSFIESGFIGTLLMTIILLLVNNTVEDPLPLFVFLFADVFLGLLIGGFIWGIFYESSNGFIGDMINDNKELGEISKLVDTLRESNRKLSNISSTLKDFNMACSFLTTYDNCTIKAEANADNECFIEISTESTSKDAEGNKVMIKEDKIEFQLDRESFYKTVNKDSLDFSWLDGELVDEVTNNYNIVKDCCRYLESHNYNIKANEVLALPEFKDQDNSIVVILED